MTAFLLIASVLVIISPARAAEMHFSSAVVQDGKPLPMRLVCIQFGCAGENISPDLGWSGLPAASKSFAVTLFDPDARSGQGWSHWIIFNILPMVMQLPAGAGGGKTGAMPHGAIQSVNNFGTARYDGPCPPPGSGTHHYIFTVFALDVEKIPLDADAAPAGVNAVLQQHTIASATLTGLYQR